LAGGERLRENPPVGIAAGKPWRVSLSLSTSYGAAAAPREGLTVSPGAHALAPRRKGGFLMFIAKKALRLGRNPIPVSLGGRAVAISGRVLRHRKSGV